MDPTSPDLRREWRLSNDGVASDDLVQSTHDGEVRYSTVNYE